MDSRRLGYGAGLLALRRGGVTGYDILYMAILRICEPTESAL